MSVAINKNKEIPEQVDVGIITILLDFELPAIKRAFEISRDTDPIKVGDGYYWFTKITSKDSTLDIAITVAGEQGNEQSKTVTKNLIGNFNPKVIMLVGIAAGVRDKVNLGDVVVSESVFYYEPAKLKSGGETEPEWDLVKVPTSLPKDVEMSFSQQNVINYWHRAFHVAEGDLKSEVLPDPQEILHPKLHRGMIASGEKILEDGRLKTMPKKNHRRIRAGEKEGWGFAQAAEKAGKSWIVIRGISDYGDPETHEDAAMKDKYHHSAANAAATCARTILECVYSPSTKEAVVPEEHDKTLPETPKINPWILFGKPIELTSLSKEDFWINVADGVTKTLKLRIILPSGRFEGSIRQLPLISDGMFLPDVIASIANLTKESDIRLDVQTLFDIDVARKEGEKYELQEDLLSECNLILTATGDINLATRLLLQHESFLNLRPGPKQPESDDICGVHNEYPHIIHQDLGFLSVCRSPFNDKRIVILACGVQAIGTLGVQKLLHLYITGKAKNLGNNRVDKTIAAKIVNFQRKQYRFPLIVPAEGTTKMELRNINVDELIDGMGVVE
jgi:nucleoside phosphorylase